MDVMMKKILISLSLLLSTSFALAQMPFGLDDESLRKIEKQMRSMMSGMKGVEQCMNQVNQSNLDALGERASKLKKDIKQMCEQGKRTEAQNKVIEFGKELKVNKDLNQMKQCMGPIGSMMAMSVTSKFDGIEKGSEHICNQL